MKIATIIVAGFVSVLMTSRAPAQAVVRITGAQAFGDAVHRGILHILQNSGHPFTYAYTGADVNKAQQTIWTGTLSGAPVIIKTSYNGSTAGVRVVTKGTNVNWLVDATAQSGSGAGNAPNTGANVEAVQGDAAAVDSFQGSTIYTIPQLVDRQVGAGAYVFVASKDAPPNLTNITTQQAQALYAVGNLPLAVFTGSDLDRTTLVPPSNEPIQVFATGRDYESGARLITLIETGIGAETNIQQYKPVISGSAVVSHELYPAATINGIFFPPGSDGNPSNGNLATTVLTKSTLTTIGGVYVSYLPTLDAANAVNAGAARILSYNGVPYTPANVANGSYSLWAYEHLLYKNSLTPAQKNVLNTLADQLLNADATLLISSLHVSRPVDGGIITHDY